MHRHSAESARRTRTFAYRTMAYLIAPIISRLTLDLVMEIRIQSSGNRAQIRLADHITVMETSVLLISERNLKDESADLSQADARRFAIVTSLSVPTVLSFVAAFVDVVFYLGIFDTFVAFITGTIIIMFAELAEPNGATLNKIAVLPTFIVALSLWTLLIKAMRIRGYQVILHHILLFQAALLAITMIFSRPGSHRYRVLTVGRPSL